MGGVLWTLVMTLLMIVWLAIVGAIAYTAFGLTCEPRDEKDSVGRL